MLPLLEEEENKLQNTPTEDRCAVVSGAGVTHDLL